MKIFYFFLALFIFAVGVAEANSEIREINGVNLSIKEAGQGQAIILLHGKNYSKEYMDSLFNYYAKNYHVFSYDARGHGESSKPKSFTLEDDADDLAGTRGIGDTYPPERISEAKDENDAAIIGALINFDLMKNIDRVKIPALLITGENDAVNPPNEARKVADALSNAKFFVVPNAPHVAFMNERERQIVFSLIDKFLGGSE